MGRSYTIENTSYPSVTTVLGILDKSQALMPWAVKMALEYVRDHSGEADLDAVLDDAKTEWRKISKEALDIGSAVHDAIECYIKHGVDKTKEEIYNKPDMTPEQREAIDNAFIAFLEWEKENGVLWHHSEMTVTDTEAGYAGTLDAVATFQEGPYKGQTMVIDFKSSKAFYSGMGKQIAAYRHAYSQIDDMYEVTGCGVLRLDKETGQPEFKDYSDCYEQKLNAFLKLLDFYYADKKRRLKNNPFVIKK